MENYHRLSSDLFNRFITIPEDFLKNIVNNLGVGQVGHIFTNHPTNKLLTQEGIKYFSDREFHVDKLVGVFKMTSGETGPIHSDNRRVGVNVVIQGEGPMEWLDVDADIVMRQRTLKSGDIVKYPMFENFRSVVPVDKIDTKVGDVLIVRIDVPHRVSCTSDDDRIVLSFRMTWDHDNLNYDQLISNFK